MIVSYEWLLLNIFYHRSGTMYLELYFWILSGACGNCCFLKKNIFKIIILYFLYPKASNFHYSGMICRRKLPDLLLNNIFFALSIGLQYTLSFKWPDFGLRHSVAIMLKIQSLKFSASVLYEIFPFLKESGIIHFFNWKIWNKKERKRLTVR